MNNVKVTPNLKPVIPYMEHFLNENKVIRPPSTLDEIRMGFKVLFQKSLQGDVAALRITEFLRAHLTNHEMAARKSSARDFEDFFSLMFGGEVQDNVKSTNEKSSLIDKNANKKKDVVFETGLEISIKSFVESNTEVNLGAFSAQHLFEGFIELGSERRQLGSKPQLKLVFDEIYASGRWEEFCIRFALMVEHIYREDLVLIRKGNDNIDIYLLPQENLHFALIEAVRMGPETAVRVLNRFEGHSLRVSRDFLLSRQFSEYIGFNFGYTQGHKLAAFDEAKRAYDFKDDMGIATEEDYEEMRSKKPVFENQRYSTVLHYSNFDKKIQNRFANGELDIHINFGYTPEEVKKY